MNENITIKLKSTTTIQKIIKFLVIISSMRLPRTEAEFKTDYFIARCNLFFYLTAALFFKSICLTIGLFSLYLLAFDFHQFVGDLLVIFSLVWLLSSLFIFKSALKFVYPIPTESNQIPDKITKQLEVPPLASLLLFTWFYILNIQQIRLVFLSYQDKFTGIFIVFLLAILYFSKDIPSYIRRFNTKYNLLKLQLILPYNTSYSDIQKMVKKLNANDYPSKLLPNTVLIPHQCREHPYPFVKKELFVFDTTPEEGISYTPEDFVNYHFSIVKAYNENYKEIKFETLSRCLHEELHWITYTNYKEQALILTLFYKKLNELGYFQGEQGSSNAYQFFFHGIPDSLIEKAHKGSFLFPEMREYLNNWFAEVFSELYQRDPYFFETIEMLASKEELEKMAFYETLKLSTILPTTNKHTHNVIKI